MTSFSRFRSPLLALLVLLAIGYAPLVWLHFVLLWKQPQYQHFPFIVGAVAWLVWSRVKLNRDNLLIAPTKALAISLVVLAWFLLAVAVFLFSPWLAVLSLLVLWGIGLQHLKRNHSLENALGIWTISLLVLPVPLGLDRTFVQWLQGFSSHASSHVLDGLGVLHLMDGNVLKLTNKQLFVNEACSGIISVMSVIACAAIYSVWKNRPLAHFGLNVVLAVAWAMTMNVGRITGIAVAQHYWNIDLSTGLPHEILGLGIFVVTFVALISTDALLLVALAPVESQELGRNPGRLTDWYNRSVRLGDPIAAGQPVQDTV